MAYSSHYAKAYLNQCHSLFKRLFRSKIKILRNVSSTRYSLFFSYVFGQYVAQLFLLHTMCEIFRHFFLSLACATAQMKLNFWLSLSGKQGQNPCFRPQLCTKIWVLHHDRPVTSATVKLQIRLKEKFETYFCLWDVTQVWLTCHLVMKNYTLQPWDLSQSETEKYFEY